MPLPRFPPRRTIRPDAGALRRLRLLRCLLVPLVLPAVLAMLGACGSAPGPAPSQEAPRRRPELQPFAVQEQPFLVDPLTGYPRQADPERQDRIQAAHRALLTASDREGALETAEELLQEDPAFAPAQVLMAQIELGEGSFAKAVERLLPVSDEMPQYVASQLVLGRAAEHAGDVPLAYSAYREIAPRN